FPYTPLFRSLEGAQLAHRHRMADVQVGPRRVEALLYPERSPFACTALELAGEVLLRDDLHRIAADLVHLFVYGCKACHGADTTRGAERARGVSRRGRHRSSARAAD